VLERSNAQMILVIKPGRSAKNYWRDLWQYRELMYFLAWRDIALGLLLAALNVEYRDFRYIVPFIVQFGLFILPIAFSTADVPAAWRTLYALNPMVGVFNGFRRSILGGRTPLDPMTVGTSVVVTLSLLLLGVWYFRRMERSFADVI
jgi:lipopolysaccharide transport system permease protein